MDRKIKVGDLTILAAKRFLNAHSPPAPLTDVERFKTKLRHLREWLLKDAGHIPKNAVLIDDSSPELAKKARLNRDVPPWPKNLQIR